MCSQNIVGLRALHNIVPVAQRGLVDPRSLPFVDPSWPHFRYGFDTDVTGIIKYEGAEVLLPYNLLGQALSDPIHTLAKLAHTASKINDIAIGRYESDDISTHLRATATYAQVLGKASRLYPDFALTPSQERLIAQFPYGITSLSPHEQEPDINGNQIPNYWKN